MNNWSDDSIISWGVDPPRGGNPLMGVQIPLLPPCAFKCLPLRIGEGTTLFFFEFLIILYVFVDRPIFKLSA